MDPVRVIVLVALIVLIAYTVRRVLRWMGHRGWIFYGRQPTRPIGSRSAMALLEFETLFNPAVEHVLEYRRHGDLWVQESGEGDTRDD